MTLSVSGQYSVGREDIYVEGSKYSLSLKLDINVCMNFYKIASIFRAEK
jgi:hypothetical protein